MRNNADILSSLPDLSAGELQELQARVGLLLGNAAPATTSSSTAPEVFELIRDRLRQRGDSAPPWSVWSRRAPASAVKALKEGAATLERFVTKYLCVSKRVDRLLATKILIQVVIAGMADRQFQRIKVDTVGSELQRLRDHVESAFPGYIDSGWLPLIIKRVAARRRHRSLTL